MTTSSTGGGKPRFSNAWFDETLSVMRELRSITSTSNLEFQKKFLKPNSYWFTQVLRPLLSISKKCYPHRSEELAPFKTQSGKLLSNRIFLYYLQPLPLANVVFSVGIQTANRLKMLDSLQSSLSLEAKRNGVFSQYLKQIRQAQISLLQKIQEQQQKSITILINSQSNNSDVQLNTFSILFESFRLALTATINAPKERGINNFYDWLETEKINSNTRISNNFIIAVITIFLVIQTLLFMHILSDESLIESIKFERRKILIDSYQKQITTKPEALDELFRTKYLGSDWLSIPAVPWLTLYFFNNNFSVFQSTFNTEPLKATTLPLLSPTSTPVTTPQTAPPIIKSTTSIIDLTGDDEASNKNTRLTQSEPTTPKKNSSVNQLQQHQKSPDFDSLRFEITIQEKNNQDSSVANWEDKILYFWNGKHIHEDALKQIRRDQYSNYSRTQINEPNKGLNRIRQQLIDQLKLPVDIGIVGGDGNCALRAVLCSYLKLLSDTKDLKPPITSQYIKETAIIFRKRIAKWIRAHAEQLSEVIPWKESIESIVTEGSDQNRIINTTKMYSLKQTYGYQISSMSNLVKEWYYAELLNLYVDYMERPEKYVDDLFMTFVGYYLQIHYNKSLFIWYAKDVRTENPQYSNKHEKFFRKEGAVKDFLSEDIRILLIDEDEHYYAIVINHPNNPQTSSNDDDVW